MGHCPWIFCFYCCGFHEFTGFTSKRNSTTETWDSTIKFDDHWQTFTNFPTRPGIFRIVPSNSKKRPCHDLRIGRRRAGYKLEDSQGPVFFGDGNGYLCCRALAKSSFRRFLFAGYIRLRLPRKHSKQESFTTEDSIWTESRQKAHDEVWFGDISFA